MKNALTWSVVAVAVAAFGLPFPGHRGSARAAELDCGELAGRLKAGDDYQLKLGIQDQIIRLEFGSDYCSEPAKTWFDRGLVLPPPARREIALPPAALQAPPSEVFISSRPAAGGNDVLPVPGRRIRRANKMPPAVKESPAATPPPTISRVKTPEIKTLQNPESVAGPLTGPGAKPKKTAPCDRKLTDFWQAGMYTVDGQRVYLSGVFTIDINGDGRVDNVGFKIGARGRIGNVLHYFPVAKGRLSARSVKALRLNNDDDLYRLCAGNVTFSKMTGEERKNAVAPTEKRPPEQAYGSKTAAANIAKKERAAKASESKGETTDLKAEKKTRDFIFWAMVLSGLFFTFGGVGLFLVIRRMKSEAGEEDVDEYEDDEES